MGLPEVYIEGRLGTNPELRFTPSGAAVCNFRVAGTERKFNQQTNQWEDARTCWLSVACWRQLAENVTESLTKGDAVVIKGVLFEETYTKDGQERTVMRMEAKSVSPALSSTTVSVNRTQRQQGQQGQQQGQQGWGPPPGQQTPQQGQQTPQQGYSDDPWATTGQQSYNEPPF